ncbi:MmyB family transcriptional regulator [Streptomyces sp. NPDC001939]
METGGVRFRDDQVYRIGRLFRLTEDEFTLLYLLGLGRKPPHALQQDRNVNIPSLSAWQEVLDAQEQMAYVTNVHWDLVAHNSAFSELFEGGVPPRNTMRWMVFSPEARHKVLLDWERSWAPPVLNQLRAAVIESPEDPVLGQLVKDVLADPVAGPIYQRIPTSYLYPDGDHRPLFHRKKGRGEILMVSAAPSSAPRARIIVLNMKITEPVPGAEQANAV